MMIDKVGSMLLVLGLVFLTPAYADSNGKFPGKGSVADYNRAIDFCDKGLACAHRNDYQGAIVHYRKAIAVYPFDAAMHSNLGRMLDESGNDTEALACFKRAVEIEPNFFKAWLGLGDVYNNLHKREDAVRCYRKAVELKPNSYAAIGSLGDTLRELGKFKEARMWLVKAKTCSGGKGAEEELAKALKQCDEDEMNSKLKERSK